MQTPLIKSSRLRLVLTLVLAGLAVLGNYLHLPLYYGVDFIFGSIAALFALLVLGVWPAVFVAAAGASYTLLLWGHPYAMLILVLEPLLVGLLRRRITQLVLADAVYWLCFAAPLLLLIYPTVLGVDWNQAELVALKQGLNGVMNAVIACLMASVVLTLLPSDKTVAQRIPIANLLFNILLMVTMLAAMLPVFMDSRARHLELESDIDARLQRVAERVIAHLMASKSATLATAPLPEDMSAALLAEDGRVLASRGTLRSLGDGGTLSALSGGARIWLPGGEMTAMQRWRRGMYLRELPVADAGPVARIRLEHAAAPWVTRIERHRSNDLILLSVLTLFAMLIAAVFSGWLTRSVRRLDHASRDLPERIASGVPASISSSRIAEYDSLAASIRAMAETLTASFRAVREMRDTLEQRVRERTAELEKREAMLAESEARFRNMADAAPALIWLSDNDNLGIWYNTRWLEYTGRSLEQELGLGWVAGMHPDDLDRCVRYCNDAFAARRAFEMEFRLRRADGSYGWIADTGIPRFNAAGEFEGYIGYCWDVTDRKVAELQLQRLSRVASQTTNGVVITDVEGRVEWINEGFTRISGYGLDELRGRTPGSVLQGADSDPATVAVMREALRRREPFVAELINYNKRGEPYWIRISCNPLSDAAGNLQGFMAIQSDVTEEKKAAERIVDSERRLAAVIDGTHIGTWEWNVQTGATVFNARWAEIVGYTLEELEPISIQTWVNLAHPDDLQRSNTLLERHFAGELPYYDVECRMRHKDGHWVWVHDRGRVVNWNADGKPLLMSGTHADITERKRMERLKDEFISTVSHELRTPLTSISGALGLLLGGVTGELSTQAREMLDIAHKNSQRLTHLIDDLLDMEKLAAGKLSFEMRVQDLMPLVEQALRDNQAYADRFRVRFLLAKRADGVRVNVDALRLQQVLANLLSNAAKFSHEGATVEVEVTRHAARVCVEVIDHGLGIPQTFHPYIFEKFSQVDASNTRQRGGTGLGLAISKELIERMHGTIGFASEPGQGARFHFELPVQ